MAKRGQEVREREYAPIELPRYDAAGVTLPRVRIQDTPTTYLEQALMRRRAASLQR